MTELAQADLFDKARIQELVSQVLAEAKRQGATSAEVDVAVNKGFNVMVRLGEVETIEYNHDKIIEVNVYVGNKTGSASLSDVRPEAISNAVRAAINIARFTDEDPYAGLPEKDLLAFNSPSIPLYYPWNLSVNEAIELGKDCEAIALGCDNRISNSEGVTISTIEAWHGSGNSLGFVGVSPLTRHEVSCILIAKEGDEMQRDYSYTLACDANDLTPLSEVAKSAAHKTVSRLGSRRIKTCRVPVIFVAEEARSLLGHFASAIQGGNLYRKSSFLVDKLGTKVFPPHVDLYEKPFLAKSLGSTPFDDDGVYTRENKFIVDGVLNSYSLGTYSARKLGMKTTGNAGGMHNLMISTGNNDLNGLIKKMHRGLVVTELMGSAVNVMTGTYSRGASGYWVERGEIKYPVEEITIAGKLQDMYANLVEVGNDVDKRGNIQTGSILVELMMIAGA